MHKSNLTVLLLFYLPLFKSNQYEKVFTLLFGRFVVKQHVVCASALQFGFTQWVHKKSIGVGTGWAYANHH